MRLRIIIAAVLGLTAALAALAFMPSRPPATEAAHPLLALPALAANIASADRMELSHGGQALRLERRGQVWGLAQEGGFPVRAGMAAALLDNLQALRLLRPVPGPTGALGLGDPLASDPAGGTLVRVLGTTGAVLGAIILGQADHAQRPGEAQAWLTSHQIPVSVDPADWADRQLAPPEPPYTVAYDGGVDPEIIRQSLEDLHFTRARAAPQVRPSGDRVIRLVLPDGLAALAVGEVDGVAWLRVTGTAAWARRLAPYAFALPPGSRLAPGQDRL